MNPQLRILIAAVSILATLGIAPAASAQSQATAYFDNFDYQLVDLNPGDGIDPGIDFFGSAVVAQARFHDTADASTPPRYDLLDYGSGHVSFYVDSNGVYLVADNTPTSGDAVLDITHGSGTLSASSSNSFILAPYTQVTFTIYGNANELNSPGNDSSATVTATGRLYDLNGSVFEDRASLSSNAGPSSGYLSVSLRTGADQLSGSIVFENDLTAQVLSPVPEPAPAAMLAGGLVLIGAHARRRRARKAGVAFGLANTIDAP